jgi:E3 ubiquitin-protein ligase RGLG
MEQFDEALPRRRFDNFQFVCLNTCIAEARKKGVQEEIGFALAALMEVPEQFKIISKLGLMNQTQGAK